MVHVFCATEAASVIKQYSPDLIVHGLLTDKPNLERESGLYQEIEQWLPRLHTLLIGPGLGRSEYTLRIARRVLQTFVTRAGENGRMKRNVVLDAVSTKQQNLNVEFRRLRRLISSRILSNCFGNRSLETSTSLHRALLCN